MSNTLIFEGWGEGMSLKLVYMIVLYGFLIVTVIALISGAIGSREMSFELAFNRLNSPFFKIGIFSDRFTLEDDTYEDEVSICFFFVNLTFIFWKVPD